MGHVTVYITGLVWGLHELIHVSTWHRGGGGLTKPTKSRGLTLWDCMDCSPPGSSVHGILQARVMEWVAISFSRGSSWTQVSCIAGRFFTNWATREAPTWHRECYINHSHAYFLKCVLVCSGCYSKTPWAGWLKQQNPISCGSGAWKPPWSGCQLIHLLVRAFFSTYRCFLLLYMLEMGDSGLFFSERH